MKTNTATLSEIVKNRDTKVLYCLSNARCGQDIGQCKWCLPIYESDDRSGVEVLREMRRKVMN